MCLTTWLAELESRHRHAPIQLGLERVKACAQWLGVDTLPCPVILVGGTNGKGSTVSALEAIYLSAGYSVGSYVSPHVVQFNERIRLNGKWITDEALCAAFEAVQAAPGSEALTYFEWVTLAALIFFRQQAPAVCVIEVGLGGRLDATNLLDATLAILTTIDFDHEAYLGNTLEAIGYEKAGILRAHQPFIFASSVVPESVRTVARAIGANGYYVGEQYHYQCVADEIRVTFSAESSAAPLAFSSAPLTSPSAKAGGPCLDGSSAFAEDDVRDAEDDVLRLRFPLLNPQAVAAAVMAAQCLKTVLPIHERDLAAATQATCVGRLQRFTDTTKEIWVDVAHNPQSVQYLADWLKREKPNRRVHAVFSALSDKNISMMVAKIAPQIAVWHVAPLSVERAASREQLSDALGQISSKTILWYNSVLPAFLSAEEQCEPQDVVVVFGSFLTVAAILSRRST